jgi:hypothetical protein
MTEERQGMIMIMRVSASADHERQIIRIFYSMAKDS